MKNVVFLINSLKPGGPPYVLLEICKNINRKEFKPIVVLLRRWDSSKSIRNKFEELSIEIRELNCSILELEGCPGTVARKIKKNLNDLGSYVIHAHCLHPTLAVSKMGIAAIVTIHNICSEDYVAQRGKLIGSITCWRFLKAIKKINCPVALTDYMCRYYTPYVNSPITKISNGVSSKYTSLTDRVKLCEELGLDETRKIVVVSGGIVLIKNVEYIISELKKSQRHNFVCVILGKGGRMDFCKELAGDDSRFLFKGLVNNVTDYLRVADLYISASRSEGFNLSAIEATNQGVPSLLSNIPAHKEIADSIRMGSVRTYNLKENELLNAFEQIIDIRFDRQSLADKSYSIYSSAVMIGKYEELYRKLL